MDNTEDLIEAPDELTTLKARADLLGIGYHPSIGLTKLKEKIAQALAEEDEGSAPQVPSASATEVVESEGQRKQRLKKDAAALLRIRLTCLNPAKKEWDGEIITAGNSTVGTFKKFIPFNAPDGWHVPRIIYNQLVQRECQIFVSVRDGRGNMTRTGKTIREFAVEVLPPLNQDDLDELARRQAMAKAID